MRAHAVVLAAVLVHLAVAIMVGGQAPMTAEQHAQDVRSLDGRVTDLSDVVHALDKNVSSRILVLESDMAEVKWVARALAAGIVGQLLILVFAHKGTTRRRP